MHLKNVRHIEQTGFFLWLSFVSTYMLRLIAYTQDQDKDR